MNIKLASVSLATALVFGALAGNNVSAQAKTTSTAQTEKNYLIAFKKDLPSNYQDIIKNAGGQVLRAIPAVGALEVKSSNASFLDNLKGVSSVQAANQEIVHTLDKEEIRPAAADGQPVTDIPQPQDINSYWDYQWDIKEVTNDGKSYGINGGTGKGATVGVIDSGIDANHPDLKANYLGGRNFVPPGVDETETGNPADVLDRGGHGTHVAGSIAANGKLKGVGPDLKIRSYRVFPEAGSAPTAWIVDAIVAAANDRVDVINMSIGGFDSLKYYYNGQKYSDIADVLIWKRAIEYAVQKNVTVVAAGGNESLNMDDKKMVTNYLNETYGGNGLTFKGPTVETPGQIPGVVTVSSSNEWSTDAIAFYSNYGNHFIDVAAPGGDNGPIYAKTRNLAQRDFHYRTLSTWPTYLEPYFTSNLHSYALLHGTSMASPKVAGIAGVIKAAHPTYSPAQVANLIKQTAKDYGKPGQDALFGAGEANIYNALLNIKK
ncbi:S8 family serine peptidase [Ectobacillus panaciterrae]|uniref:S8 family serine peptidase n=1 Tax=Ectobacillus panaciterrae TaxID=363872 RepID=UPI00040F4236|nr:S8 family serine peptidase [Ectobacillus panaciterrae]